MFLTPGQPRLVREVSPGSIDPEFSQLGDNSDWSPSLISAVFGHPQSPQRLNC